MGMMRFGLCIRLPRTNTESEGRSKFSVHPAPLLLNAVVAVCLCALLLLPSLHHALAQDQIPAQPLVNLGDAIVTGFSGVRETDGGGAPEAGTADGKQLLIDPDGASLRGFDLSNPSAKGPLGQPLAPEFLSVTARQIGQVFGIALDDATDPSTQLPAPNIYATATSAYGLSIAGPDKDADGSPDRLISGATDAKWMEGLFGEDKGGGPGSVWKIDGITGEVTLFANITYDETPNSGAALGNITFDRQTRQFFVSDRDTGLIHRLDMTGNLVGAFDHGTAGRSTIGLEAVPLDADNRADITVKAFKASDPSTWGLADTKRRVWGLAVHDNRLYYAVAVGPQIWSVGLKSDGSFDTASVRWELDLPDDVEPHEVADIAFTRTGQMILVQRPPASGAADFRQLVKKGAARVLRYQLESPKDPNTKSRWGPVPQEYAVGLTGDHRSATGGVALGYGYGQSGAIDQNACEATMWTTGDGLRENPLKTVDVRDEPREGMADGFQGTPVGMVRPSNVPPTGSFAINYDGQYPEKKESGHVGDIEIASQCPGEPEAPPAEPGVAPPSAPYPADPGVFPPGPPGVPPGPPAPQEADLAIEKRLTGPCQQGKDCPFEIVVTNLGPADYQGPLILSDTLSVPGVTLAANAPAPWNCQQAGAQINCTRPTLLLKPGHSASLPLTLRYTGNPNIGSWQNCVALTWLGQGTGNAESVRAVQTELARLGYYTGAIDGIAGSGTKKAIRDLEKASGLPETGKITPTLLDWLFGAGATSTATDPNAGNDTACVTVPTQAVPPPPPPGIADLAIEKTALDPECYANKTCKFKITLTNKGPGPYKGALKFTDKMPNGWSYSGVQPAGWQCQSINPGQFTCDLPVPLIWPPATTLKVGESKHVTIELDVPANQKQGEVDNCATFDIAKGQNNPTDCAKIKVAAKPVFTIVKTQESPCAQGKMCRFKVTVNTGSGGDFGEFLILDQLPPQWTAIVSAAPSNTGCKLQGQLIECGPLSGMQPANKTYSWHFDVLVPANHPPGKVENCAEVNFRKFGRVARSCVNVNITKGFDLAAMVVGPIKCRAGDKACGPFNVLIRNILNSPKAYTGPIDAIIAINPGKPAIPGLKFKQIKSANAPWWCDKTDVGKTGSTACHYGLTNVASGAKLKFLKYSLAIPDNAFKPANNEIEVCAALNYQGKPDDNTTNDHTCHTVKLGGKKPGGNKYKVLQVFKRNTNPCIYNVEDCIFDVVIAVHPPTQGFAGKIKVEDVFSLSGWKLVKSPASFKCTSGGRVHKCEKHIDFNAITGMYKSVVTTWGLRWLGSSESPKNGFVTNCANLYIDGTYVDQDCINIKMETGRSTFSIGLGATGTPVCTPPNCSSYEFEVACGNAPCDGAMSMKIMPPPGASLSTPRFTTSSSACPASGFTCTRSGAEFGGAFDCRIAKCALAPGGKVTARIEGNVAPDLKEPPETEQTREVCGEMEFQPTTQTAGIEQKVGVVRKRACVTTRILARPKPAKPVTCPTEEGWKPHPIGTALLPGWKLKKLGTGTNTIFCVKREKVTDLQVSTAPKGRCTRGQTCAVGTLVSNAGREVYAGSIEVRGKVSPPVSIRSLNPSSGWSCRTTGGGRYTCRGKPANFAPGVSARIHLGLAVPRNFRHKQITHSVRIAWPQGKGDANPANDLSIFTIPIFALSPPPAPPPPDVSAPAPQPPAPPQTPKVAPPFGCPDGQVRRRGKCVCPSNRPVWTGRLCIARPQSRPTCAQKGMIGNWPNCKYRPKPKPRPTCAQKGMIGNWPNCKYRPRPKPRPTCAQKGMIGNWPNCKYRPRPIPAPAPPPAPPSCTGGKVRAVSRCVCPQGTIEIRGGRCVRPPPVRPPPPPKQGTIIKVLPMKPLCPAGQYWNTYAKPPRCSLIPR